MEQFLLDTKCDDGKHSEMFPARSGAFTGTPRSSRDGGRVCVCARGLALRAPCVLLSDWNNHGLVFCDERRQQGVNPSDTHHASCVWKEDRVSLNVEWLNSVMKYWAISRLHSIAHAAYELLRSVSWGIENVIFLMLYVKYVIFLDHESCSADKLNDPFRIMVTNVTPWSMHR